MFQVASHPAAPRALFWPRLLFLSLALLALPFAVFVTMCVLVRRRRTRHCSFRADSPAPPSPISCDILAAATPDLFSADVPSEFIRYGLLAKSSWMEAGIASLAKSHVPSTRDRMPVTLGVPLRAVPAGALRSYPTHVLAISAPPSKSSHGYGAGREASLFSLHAVVHCSKLPLLPPAPDAHSTLTLLVLPINLPCSPAFAFLHAWMYTGRLDAALGSLIHLPPSFLASRTPLAHLRLEPLGPRKAWRMWRRR
ncbi:hypothetical protein MSAN_00943000 [Mycena sanguinolenta]|uniref:Uncharacterized protein n=1 Tax=Mycena sanguinolenta TaxID=230812 RepID=A0A8H6YZX9_9AGAR|nr:hypothetical protein MSAN_00943000 [Mycena sanguinolenta]